MQSDLDLITAALAECSATGLGETVVYNGRNLRAIVDTITDEMRVILHGIDPQSRFTVVLQRADFTGPNTSQRIPTENDLITVRNREYRIGKIMRDEVSYTFPACDPD